MPEITKRKAWTVVLAGTGINLALGILYTWSVFKGAIKDSIEAGGEKAFAWDLESLNDPYVVCVVVFAFSMILAGRVQDRYGPRITAFIGGLLVALGFILISLSTFGFGALWAPEACTGRSLALGRWFHPATVEASP